MDRKKAATKSKNKKSKNKTKTKNKNKKEKTSLRYTARKAEILRQYSIA